MKLFIDINADVGEGVGNEADLMPFLASCNIACGSHAGNEETMRTVLQHAIDNKVKIGAHPSFPDKRHFGRKVMTLSAVDLYTTLKSQIRRLERVAEEFDVQLHHIKPHGALYNLAAKDEKTAQVIIEVIKSIAMPLKLYAPYKSVIANVAKSEAVPVIFEAFADRNYNDDLSLVSRKNKDALITNKKLVFEHTYHMFQHEKVKTVNGVEVDILASTFCVHSDTENAVEIARYLYKRFNAQNIKIQ